MPTYAAICGTFSWRNRLRMDLWWQLDSPFSRFLLERGFEPIRTDETFMWSTNVNGLQGWRRWFRWLPGVTISSDADHNDWETGGRALRWYLAGYRPAIIAHSHGGQVVAYAAAQGLKIPLLITVATPVRADMTETIRRARPNIGYWLHLFDPDKDKWMERGGFGDGHLGVQRRQPRADVNQALPEMRHGRILETPDLFPTWQDEGWLDLIRQYANGPDRAA